MRKNVIAILMLIASSSQAGALSEERAERLFDVLESSLHCDAVSGYLRAALADERNRLREVWTGAGMELGKAMFSGEMPNSVLEEPKRCLIRFNFAEQPSLQMTDAAFAVGFELGGARSCFAQKFYRELKRELPLVGLSEERTLEQEVKERELVQGYAMDQYKKQNCSFVSIPE